MEKRNAIQRSTLAKTIAERIREMILSGEIQPGEFLPSRKELAAQFDVSASTINEAVQALAAVGFVQSRPGKGTWVSPDALATVIHPAEAKARLGDLNVQMLHEARSVIEVATTELAADRATSEEVSQIWDALSAMEESVAEQETFVEADLEFHLAVAKASHNDLLMQFYHLSRRLLTDFLLEATSPIGVREDAVQIQRKIAEAIEERDTQKARQTAVEHMKYVTGLIRGDEVTS